MPGYRSLTGRTQQRLVRASDRDTSGRMVRLGCSADDLLDGSPRGDRTQCGGPFAFNTVIVALLVSVLISTVHLTMGAIPPPGTVSDRNPARRLNPALTKATMIYNK